MQCSRAFLEDEVFHTRISKFLAGLTEQNHQYNPLDLLDINIWRFKREKAIDQNFALSRSQDSDLLEVGNESARTGVEAYLFDVVIYSGAVLRLEVVGQAVVVFREAV